MKKVYFAGSIRGGHDDVEIYEGIINRLREKYEVLTELVGVKDIDSIEEKTMTDVQIYEKDCAWMKECDFMVAEVSTPSLGVGYEIAYAESLGKPIICLFRTGQGRKLSAMINGNKNIRVITYKSLEDINI